jgi:hypothetical protein
VAKGLGVPYKGRESFLSNRVEPIVPELSGKATGGLFGVEVEIDDSLDEDENNLLAGAETPDVRLTLLGGPISDGFSLFEGSP